MKCRDWCDERIGIANAVVFRSRVRPTSRDLLQAAVAKAKLPCGHKNATAGFDPDVRRERGENALGRWERGEDIAPSERLTLQ